MQTMSFPHHRSDGWSLAQSTTSISLLNHGGGHQILKNFSRGSGPGPSCVKNRNQRGY
jgi:hypothetical protein